MKLGRAVEVKILTSFLQNKFFLSNCINNANGSSILLFLNNKIHVNININNLFFYFEQQSCIHYLIPCFLITLFFLKKKPKSLSLNIKIITNQTKIANQRKTKHITLHSHNSKVRCMQALALDSIKHHKS